jgi:hypothetical protein
LCKNVKCDELKQVVWQNDFEFISILEKVSTTPQNSKDMEFFNKISLKTPPIDNTLPYLFYTNAKTIQHNKNIFEKKLSNIHIVNTMCSF